MEKPFQQIRQAMGTPKGRTAAAAYLRTFIEEMEASGSSPMRSSAAITRMHRSRPQEDR